MLQNDLDLFKNRDLQTEVSLDQPKNGAIARLSRDRKFRPFKNARILEVGEIN